MKNKICTACMLGLIVIGIFCGCETSTNGKESSFMELDVHYTINDDGTYNCRGYTFRYMIEVSGVDGEAQVTFIVLTNDIATKFEDITYSLRRSDSITVPEFIILGWYY